MFASTEPTAALKLIDFGCSLSALEAPATNYMHMAGTLEHTAPETFAAFGLQMPMSC